MIKTSTLSSSLHTTKTAETLKEEQKSPNPDGNWDAEPSAYCINNILSYSKSLKVFNSELINKIEIVHT